MRRRLVAVALAVTAMVVLAFLIPLAGLVRELARNRALTAAERDAQLVARLVTVVGPDTGYAEALAALGIVTTLNGRPVSLVLEDGTVIGAPVPEDEDLGSALRGAAGDRSVAGGAAVYVPVVGETARVVVRVFVADEELRRNVAQSWLILAALGAALVLIGVAAADRLGRSLVRPVEDLSHAARELGDGNLAARVEPSGPAELVEVGTRFNELAGRVADLLQEERETAADLSHRLRTPLTAARLDAEALRPGPERERLLADLAELERTIDFIIRESRRAGRQGEAGLCDLRAAVVDRAAFWSALAEEQGRRAGLLVPADGPLPVRIEATDLEAAIDALVGNVFAHTGDGAAYEIGLERHGDVAIVSVDDAGDGLPGGIALARGESAAGSTGLGLDIARRTAEAAGGKLVAATSRLGGARLAMELPVADEPSAAG
jgi:signal transduction histidine kinase